MEALRMVSSKTRTPTRFSSDSGPLILPGLEEISSENFNSPDREFGVPGPLMAMEPDPFEKSSRIYSLTFIFAATILEAFACNTLVYAVLPNVSTPALFGSPSSALGTVIGMYILIYLFSFLSGLASDSWVSRFWTIFWGYFLYIFGYALALVAFQGSNFTCVKPVADVMPNPTSECTGIGITILLITSVGAGIVKGNLPIFGADQTGHLRHSSNFFYAFHLFGSIGAGISCVFISILTDKKILFNFEPLIYSFCILCFSFMALLMGREKYLYSDDREQEDATGTIIGVISATQSRRTREQSRRRHISRFEVLREKSDGIYSRDMVDGVERYLRLIHVFASLVPYNMVSLELMSSFRVQALHMKTPDWATSAWNGTDSTRVIASPFMWIGSSLLLQAIILLGCVIGGLTYGLDLTKKTLSIRWFFGMMLSALSLLGAGILEAGRSYWYQKCLADRNKTSNDCYTMQKFSTYTYRAVNISVLWQTPMYLIAAISYVLVTVTAYQFAYLVATDSEQCRFQGLFLGLLYFSQVVGAILVFGVSAMTEDSNYFCRTFSSDYCDPNEANMYLYFYILALTQIVGAFWNWLALRGYFKWERDGKGFFF